MRKPATLILVISLASCSFFQEEEYTAPKISEVISELPRAHDQSAQVKNLSIADIARQLEEIDHEELKPAINNRLAQLRLAIMEEELIEGETDFSQPRQALQTLKNSTTDKALLAKIDYQLARVAAISNSTGDEDPVLKALTRSIEQSSSSESAENTKSEARFRRAEINFSRGDYKAAEADFVEVASSTGEYQLHATYMLAWVHFKQGDLDFALSAAIKAFQYLEFEDKTNRELKKDLLRATVLALDYTDGPITLAALMADAGMPEWQTGIYRALGDWYLSKQRYVDSALTWQTFLDQNPLHARAPEIALEVMKTQREAGFVADIPKLEQGFIFSYGKQTDFYALHGDAVFESYAEPMRIMLDRYVQRLHSAAQDVKEGKETAYKLAASGYAVWLENFIDTEAGQEKQFLYAEVLEKAYGFVLAKSAYEQVIEMNPVTDFAREASYALVAGFPQFPDEFSVHQLIAVNLSFVAGFPDDHRAPAAQLNAAKHLFENELFERARTEAAIALDMNQDAGAQLIAKRITAHSAFELKDYKAAEDEYRNLINLGEDNQTEFLASIFKQAEVAETRGDLVEAIHHFKRLVEIAPETHLARDTAYDLATLYEQIDRPDMAITQLLSFRQQYPEQQVVAATEISKRVIGLREAVGDLKGAAEELLALSKRATGDSKRVSIYRAAELYLEAGETQQAIQHFRYYAHNFLEPVSLRMEAMHHMDVLYQQTKEEKKRKFWLRKKRDLYRSLDSSEQTDRAKYLAANAIYILSESGFEAYKNAKLTAPLPRSLKKKQQLLARSLANYQAVLDVGALEYTSKGQLRMAQHYEVLARDLMASSVPKGLNELETEQYQLLLEEQAFPFEEKAIALHEENLKLGWQFGWAAAINESLDALKSLSPGQFSRAQREVDYVNAD